MEEPEVDQEQHMPSNNNVTPTMSNDLSEVELSNREEGTAVIEESVNIENNTVESEKQRTTALKISGVIAKSSAKLFSEFPDLKKSEATSESISNDDKSDNQSSWEASTLNQYWQFVRENPYDFDGWTTLLGHVETLNSLDQARAAYDSFLPLYPYCFAYWKKLSGIEQKFNGSEYSLGVLLNGVECIPASIDLWIPLFKQFISYARDKKISNAVVTELYEYALSKVGYSWQSSKLWEAIINYEQDFGKLSKVLNLYRRLLNTPTKLYNRHWDCVVALIRDHDPQTLLSHAEYCKLKKQACKDLKIKYSPPTAITADTCKVQQPEDKLTACIKEKILASLIKTHEENEKQVNKRWKMEEKIKRPYFHVKPLDKKQLKNWKDYLEFELGENDPVRIITLFERCLVACALYQDYWAMYGSYMENHAQNVADGKFKDQYNRKDVPDSVDNMDNDSNHSTKECGEENQPDIITDFSAVKVKLEKDDGSYERHVKSEDDKNNVKLSSVNINIAVKSESKVLLNVASKAGVSNDIQVKLNSNIHNKIIKSETQAKSNNNNKGSDITNDQNNDPVNVQTDDSSNINNKFDDSSVDNCLQTNDTSGFGCVNDKDSSNVDSFDDITDIDNTNSSNIEISSSEPIYKNFSDLKVHLCQGVSVGGRVLSSPPLTPAWVLTGVSWEDVRHVYRRAVWIHCPNKPKLLMQWAEFEESQGNNDTARDLLQSAISKHPLLLKPRMQLIEMERRAKNFEKVEELYSDAFKNIKENVNKSWLAIRYARFLFKMLQDADRALIILRKALKKDRGNIHLYHHVFDICYQRQPVDSGGVLASVKLALASKDLTTDIKVQFSRKRVEFLREHGSMAELKEAQAELSELQASYAEELEEARQKKIEEEKAEKAKEQKEAESKPGENTDKEKSSEDDNKGTTVVSTSTTTTTTASTSIPTPTQLNTPPFPTNNEPPQPYHPQAMHHSVPPPTGAPPPFSNPHPNNPPFNTSLPPNHQPYPRQFGPNSQAFLNQPPPHNTHPYPNNSNPRGPPPNQGYPPTSQGQDAQQFSSPFFSNDGTIQYTPMAGYGYGHSDPNQQLPTADEVIREQSMNDPNKPEYHNVPMTWEDQNRYSYGYGVDNDELQKQSNSAYSHYDQLLSKGYPSAMKDKMIIKEDHFNIKLNLDLLRPKRPPTDGPGNNPPLPGVPPLQPPPKPSINLARGPANSMSPHFPHGGVRPGNGYDMRPASPFDNPMKRPFPGNDMSQGGPPLKMPCPPQQGPYGPNPNQQQGPCGPYHGPPGPQHGGPQFRPEFNQNYNEFQNDGGRPNRSGTLGNYTSLSELLHGPKATGSAPATYNEFNRDRLQELKKRLLPEKIPKAMDDAKSPLACVNVPDWFVREGGELKLSETDAGVSSLRYWPKFMTPEGYNATFRVLRKAVKWHQRQMNLGDSRQNVPRLVSWIGPCHFDFLGLKLEKNAKWPPEIVDLLHRLIKCTEHQYNSCFLDLYRNGFDCMPWQADTSPALRENPPIASVSLGVIRWLELRRKDLSNFIRFPLFPGSLILMEGAVQNDWEYSIPKQPNVAGERINLTFRNMYMIEGITI